MVRLTIPATLLALTAVASAQSQNATSVNWVGPKIGRPVDTACYRKTQRGAECPVGYDSDKLGGCWAQCPLEYPVACGMECIPQSKDCGLEVITKIGVVATAAINLATSSMFSSLVGTSVSAGLKCGGDLFTVVTKLVQVVGEIQKANPTIKDDALILQLLQNSVVTTDLTNAVIGCAGSSSTAGSIITTIINLIVGQVAKSGTKVLEPGAFLQLTKDAGVGASLTAMPATDLDKFKQLIANGPACGMQLKNVIDQVVQQVIAFKKTNAKITPDQIRVQLSKTALFLNDLPTLTNKCAVASTRAADETVYDVRDTIRKALQGFIDKVVDAAYQNGNPVPIETYALVAVDLGLDALSGLDSTGLVKMVKEFVQPICGPTSMLGEIDDGPADVSVGLRMIDAAFTGSHGQWTKAGNGQVKIFFESKDTEDVTVNVWSGGSQIAQVAVPKGGKAEWTKPVKDLQDKTLYLDRWRPGFLSIPGTGGGSLLAWVPRSSAGGNFELRATLNIS